MTNDFEKSHNQEQADPILYFYFRLFIFSDCASGWMGEAAKLSPEEG